jgi:antitoxin CptB
MSVTSLSSAGLDPRRRRILFRSRRRGIREMDIALGNFAEIHLETLDEAQLAEFELWLDLPDPDLMSWVTGEVPAPAEIDTPLFRRLCAAPAEAISAGRPIT